MNFKVETTENGPKICSHARCNPACSGDIFVATVESTSLIVWGKTCEVIKVTEHKKAVLSLCVSTSSQPYLCSCSSDKVILWNINELAQGIPISGMLVGVDLGVVNYCALCPNNKWLALCRETDTWIVELQHTSGNLSAVSHLTTLDSGGTPTSLCCFSPIQTNILVTTDDSNTFKVWCVLSGRVLQRMSVGGWQRLSYCEFVPRGSLRGHLLVGTNRGELHLFAVSPCRPPRDLGSVVAAPPTRTSTGSSGAVDSCEAGCVVFSAVLLDRKLPPVDEDADDVLTELCPEPEDPTVKAILAPGALLVVCSNQGVGVYDCNSWTCLSFHLYQDLLEKSPPLLTGALVTGCSPERIRCLLGLPEASCLITASCKEDHGCSPGLSFLGMSSASARSPLRAQFSKACVDPVRAAYSSSVLLQRPVKSSGYGAVAPRNQRFTPATNSRSRREPPSKPARRLGTGAAGGILARLGAVQTHAWAPPLRQRAKITIWHDFSTAVRLASSGDGASLACSSGPSAGPGVLSVLRWSSPDVDGCVRFAGHDARVTSVGFSADSSWLVTGAGDGSTKVWDWRNRRCSLDIGDIGASTTSTRKGATSTSRAGAHGHGETVAQASFYYMDRFILRAVGANLELICHRLHEHQEHGFGARGWRRVRRIAFPTQQVLCFIAPNCFYSNLVLGGCASRSLHVYDMDAERFLLELRDAHPRPPHALAVASPSQTPSSADLFLSTAICDGVKLWDLRQARCVLKFMRHLNRAHSCGVALSPCCKYLAVGSEDKCVYVYDTRNSRDYVDKLFGLNEVVMDVVWNSCRPLLAASALNNAVAFYGEHCLDR